MRGRALRVLDYEDVELARAVHSLDALELDVGRGARPRDEGDRPALTRGWLERRDRLGHARHDLLGAHDADVVVGYEGERAAAGFGAAVEDDRARLGDRERTACQGD